MMTISSEHFICMELILIDRSRTFRTEQTKHNSPLFYLIILSTFVTFSLTEQPLSSMDSAISINNLVTGDGHDNTAEQEESDTSSDQISPKQCQAKIQFSIAQIMGFDASKNKSSEDVDDDVVKKEVMEEEDDDQPVKLWRPLAQSSSPLSPLSPLSSVSQAGAAMYRSQDYPHPAALALLRQYTFLR